MKKHNKGRRRSITKDVGSITKEEGSITLGAGSITKDE